MEIVTMNFKIYRSDNNEVVKFLIPDLDNYCVNLVDSETKDIENLFNLIFLEVIKTEKLIEFVLEDTSSDLFNELASDIVKQINQEIKTSENDFIKIIELDKV